MLTNNKFNIIQLFWQQLAIVLLLTSVSSVTAAISVDRSVMYFNAGQAPKQDVLVYNHDKQKAYIKIEVYEVFNQGTPQEKLQKATDLAALKLLVSPNKMAITSGGKKNIRFSYLGDYKKERVFRINVMPVVGKIKSDTTALKLIVAYQILLIITPDKAQANVTYVRQNKHILFKNTGNTNVLMAKAKLCTTATSPSKSCKKAQVSKRLYAGNQWSVNVPNGQFIEFEMTNGSASTRTIRRFPQ